MHSERYAKQEFKKKLAKPGIQVAKCCININIWKLKEPCNCMTHFYDSIAPFSNANTSQKYYEILLSSWESFQPETRNQQFCRMHKKTSRVLPLQPVELAFLVKLPQ